LINTLALRNKVSTMKFTSTALALVASATFVVAAQAAPIRATTPTPPTAPALVSSAFLGTTAIGAGQTIAFNFDLATKATTGILTITFANGQKPVLFGLFDAAGKVASVDSFNGTSQADVFSMLAVGTYTVQVASAAATTFSIKSTFAGTNFTAPSVVATVPEADSAVLTLAGLGLAGAVVARRRRAV
jgi:hypothetical protein